MFCISVLQVFSYAPMLTLSVVPDCCSPTVVYILANVLAAGSSLQRYHGCTDNNQRIAVDTEEEKV